MHPIQQQGRRLPSVSSVIVRLTWFTLVAGVFTSVVQQIHSFRASGVMLSQAASAFGEAVSAFRKSVGSLCATPSETVLLINLYYYKQGFNFCNNAAPTISTMKRDLRVSF
jgi:hypothetical protein